jgi:uncharacterized membrane protein
MTLQVWSRIRGSLWFVPGIIVFAATGLAVVLVELSVPMGSAAADRWPRLFGAGADGSRAMLTAIATSMITVAGVVFSITIVTLSLAASQYSSRVLRNFMDDRANQSVLGVFVGIFAYCLIVLRTIRGGSEGKFVPALAVLGGVVLAFVGIAFLVFFIHHIATEIQASHIVAAVATATGRTIERLLPDPMGPAGPAESSAEDSAWPGGTRVVAARSSGYLRSLDTAGLVRLAGEQGAPIRVERGVGEFVVEGSALLTMAGAHEGAEDATTRALSLVEIGRQRTLDSDVGYGIRQIVDVALKALSPGINDTTTAIMCIDYLTAILVQVSGRRMPPARHGDGAGLLLLPRRPTWDQLVSLAFDEVREAGSDKVVIANRLLWALEAVSEATRAEERRPVLRAQAAAVREAIGRTVPSPNDRRMLEERADRLLERLSGTARGSDPAGGRSI